MSNLILDLEKRNLIKPPKWLTTSIQYLAITGSVAYGVSTDNSDMDCYGFCIPKKEDIFHHLAGEIPGFGTQKKRFEQYIQHHIEDKDKKCNYDLTIMNIVKYFNLLLGCNPNVIDVIYSPHDCILHITQVGQLVRENRNIFLTKKAYHTHSGYSYSSINKMSNRNKRLEKIKKLEVSLGFEVNLKFIEQELDNRKDKDFFSEYELINEISDAELYEFKDILSSNRNQKIIAEGQQFDLKFSMHAVRLLFQVEQILEEGDLDLRRNSELYKSIRRGDLTEKEIRQIISEKEVILKRLYETSKLPFSANESKIKDLLLKCLEIHYGSLDKCVERVDKYQVAFDRIKEIVDNV